MELNVCIYMYLLWKIDAVRGVGDLAMELRFEPVVQCSYNKTTVS